MSRRDRQLARRLIAQHQQSAQLPPPQPTAEQLAAGERQRQLAELDVRIRQCACRIERETLAGQYARLSLGCMPLADVPHYTYQLGLRCRPWKPEPLPYAPPPVIRTGRPSRHRGKRS